MSYLLNGSSPHHPDHFRQDHLEMAVPRLYYLVDDFRGSLRQMRKTTEECSKLKLKGQT